MSVAESRSDELDDAAETDESEVQRADEATVIADADADADAGEQATGADRARRLPAWWPEALLGMSAMMLYSWQLSANGWGNSYYAAAARSMTQSWSNFFYGALDPGGWISVDKPPGALWFQAASAKLFGYSSWSILLPSAAAGALSVWMLAIVVRRVWGRTAGLVAGAALMLTPTVFAVSRSNNPDAFVMFCAVGAAWAGERLIRTGRLRWALALGAWCGAGFLSKMLAIVVVMPGIWLAVVLVANSSWRRRVVHALAAVGAAVVVAAVWVVPASLGSAGESRPYVGSSADGTAVDLVFGYNGFGRVFGGDGNGGPAGAPPVGAFGSSGEGFVVNEFGGQPGWTRLFNDGLADQVMWLAPLAAMTMVAGAWVLIRRRRAGIERSALELGSFVVFGGWSVVGYALFALAEGTFHNYYVSLLAPGLAAMVGIGVALAVRGSRVAALLAAASLAATVALAVLLVGRIGRDEWLQVVLPAVVAVVGVSAVVTLRRDTAAARSTRPEFTRPEFTRTVWASAAVGTCLLAPSWWIGHAYDGSQEGTFPDARPSTGSDDAFAFGAGGAEFGSSVSEAQLNWLRQQQTTERWIYAGSSVMDVGQVIIGGDSVMAMGGFSGGDRAMTQDRLADLVADGSLRFISVQGGFSGAFPGGGFPGGTLPGGDPTAEPAGDGGGPTGVPGGGPRSASVVMDVVRSVCTEVPATNWGDSSTTSTGLYDCQGQSAALRDAEPNAEPSAQEPAPSESPGTVPADQPPPGADMDALVECLAESGVELPDPAAGQIDAETMAALQACSAELGLPAPPGG